MEELVNTTPTDVEIRSNAALFPRLFAIEEQQAVDEIAKAITTAAFYNGNRISEAVAKVNAAALRKELLENERAMAAGCKNITTTEIASILKDAVLSDPEFRTMNVADMFRKIVSWSLNEGFAIQERANAAAQKPHPLQKVCETWAKALINNNKI